MKNNFSGLFLAFASMSLTAGAQNVVDCPFTSISSDIISNRTLSASTLYRIEGCVHVTSGVTLTIPAGTKILFEKAMASGLSIDKNAYLIANGTSVNPIIMTSDQQPGFRTPGDYSGLIINGEATNNFGSNIMTTINRTCNINAGGSDDNDSSGVLKYIRLEYAEYGLTLASVGRKTVVENLQVSYPQNSAYEFFGGVPQAKQLVALNATANDFYFNYGTRALVQNALGLRLDAASNSVTAPFSNGVLIANNDNAGVNYVGTPQTHPILDKFTLIGPKYCGATGLSSNFRNAVLLNHNAEAGIYNSLLSSWINGLRMEDSLTFKNATTTSPGTLIKFQSNSFDNNTSNFSNGLTWPTTSCAATLSDWVDGSSSLCGQPDNLLSGVTDGFDGSLCEVFCNDHSPSFLMSGSESGEYNATAELIANPFFVSSDYRGAFNETTDWTSSWTAFCPQSKVYCIESLKGLIPAGIKTLSTAAQYELLISPNPAASIFNAEFFNDTEGAVVITMTNNIGQTVKTIHQKMFAGQQKISVQTDGLSTGVYMLNITLPDTKNLKAKVEIK